MPEVGKAGEPNGSITVDIQGLHSSDGQMLCELFSSGPGYPEDSSKALALQKVKIANKQARCKFDQVQPGNYAVAFVHDENGNGQLDKNFLGIPKEGTGASNNARGHMGPPKWDDAAFKFLGGQATLSLTVAY
jgi:uncharacterized protein (DUF2141 family)